MLRTGTVTRYVQRAGLDREKALLSPAGADRVCGACRICPIAVLGKETIEIFDLLTILNLWLYHSQYPSASISSFIHL